MGVLLMRPHLSGSGSGDGAGALRESSFASVAEIRPGHPGCQPHPWAGGVHPWADPGLARVRAPRTGANLTGLQSQRTKEFTMQTKLFFIRAAESARYSELEEVRS